MQQLIMNATVGDDNSRSWYSISHVLMSSDSTISREPKAITTVETKTMRSAPSLASALVGQCFGHQKIPMSTTMITVLLMSLLWPPTAGLCPNGCVCNDETFVVMCERNKLDVLPIALNPAIQRLVLRNNKIKTVDSAFQFYKDLQYVDLSNNHLVTIPTRSFSYQSKLQEFHLNHNKLSTINNRTFQGLKSLTVLNLRENFLEELSRGLFAVLPKLEELNLGQNRIGTIDPLAFDGLHALRLLYLDDNVLTVVPSQSLSILPSLAELHIGLNTFDGIQDDAFASLTKLSVLDLSSASAANISANAFRGLTALRSLNLLDNALQTLPTAQLAPLVRLEELVLGQNHFDVLPKGCLRLLGNLRKLDISGSLTLTTVQAGAFSANLNIETIILANNKKLNTLEDGAFGGLPNLRHLVLRDNAFTHLNEQAASWNELRSLDLSDNALVCSCEMVWLVNLAHSKNLSTGHCASPLALRDKLLNQLSADDLGCSFSDPRQQAILVTLCVSAVIVLSALGLLLIRYRQRVREALKDYKWNKRAALSRKDLEYQKTFATEDDYIVRGGPMHSHHHLHSNSNHHHMHKPVPVTEL